MLKIIDSYNTVLGIIVAALTAFFGIYWYVFAAYLLCNIFDWLTGWYRSRQQGKESSIAGLKGILKKLGYWIIILISFLISYIFTALGNDILHIDLSFTTLIGWFTLASLIVNEIRSIIENLVQCGYKIPKILIQGLAVTEKLINQKRKDY